METVEQMAEDYVTVRRPELKGKLRQAAIKGYIEGYKSAPYPIVQLEINFDRNEDQINNRRIRPPH